VGLNCLNALLFKTEKNVKKMDLVISQCILTIEYFTLYSGSWYLNCGPNLAVLPFVFACKS